MNRWFEEFLSESEVTNSLKGLRSPSGDESAKSHADDLEARLTGHGISIAIDRRTGVALLLFKNSDAAIVRDVADVHEPLEVGKLTAAQRKELLDSLEYYESLLARKLKP